jgi:hypothetical protein
MKLTRVEQKVWVGVQLRTAFPRWPRWVIHSSGFYLEESPGSILGEVFRRYDGKWSVRDADDGTKRVFDVLTDAAFLHAELLHYRQQLVKTEKEYRAWQGGQIKWGQRQFQESLISQ